MDVVFGAHASAMGVSGRRETWFRRDDIEDWGVETGEDGGDGGAGDKVAGFGVTEFADVGVPYCRVALLAGGDRA